MRPAAGGLLSPCGIPGAGRGIPGTGRGIPGAGRGFPALGVASRVLGVASLALGAASGWLLHSPRPKVVQDGRREKMRQLLFTALLRGFDFRTLRYS